METSKPFGKKEVEKILDEYSLKGEHETRLNIRDSIREQDNDIAASEIRLF